MSVPVHAQIAIPGTDFNINYDASPTVDSVSLIASNEHPHPFEKVELHVESYSVELPQSTITWTLNGKKVLSGVGQINFSVTMGDLGSANSVSVTVVGPDGKTLSDSKKFIAADVDLLWQAHSYTPVFYQGKALFPYQGNVTIVAIPNFGTKGQTAGSKNYIYTWSKDGEVLGDSSGYGKDSLDLSSGIIVKPLDLSVEVSTPDGSQTAYKEITIVPQNPSVKFYQSDKLYGSLYNYALNSNFTLTNPEVTIQAVPYFFTTSGLHSISPLNFQWKINNTDTSTKANDAITLRQPGKTSGQSSVSVTITNGDNILQTANGSTIMSFSSK